MSKRLGTLGTALVGLTAVLGLAGCESVKEKYDYIGTDRKFRVSTNKDYEFGVRFPRGGEDIKKLHSVQILGTDGTYQLHGVAKETSTAIDENPNIADKPNLRKVSAVTLYVGKETLKAYEDRMKLQVETDMRQFDTEFPK